MRLLLEDILNEVIDYDSVKDAIENKYYVAIRYDDEKEEVNGSKQRRVVQPLAIGTTKKGNLVFRAYQVNGNSKRGAPKYKYFRLDRVESWKPMRNKHFYMAPDDRYNYNGDRSMLRFDMNAKFDDLSSTLDLVRAQRKQGAEAPKISTRNMSGPVQANQQRRNNVFTSHPNSEKYKQYAKNVQDTTSDGFDRFDNDVWAKAEKEKAEQDERQQMMNQVPNPNENLSGPIYDYDEDDVDFDENEFNNLNQRRRY